MVPPHRLSRRARVACFTLVAPMCPSPRRPQARARSPSRGFRIIPRSPLRRRARSRRPRALPSPACPAPRVIGSAWLSPAPIFRAGRRLFPFPLAVRLSSAPMPVPLVRPSQSHRLMRRPRLAERSASGPTPSRAFPEPLVGGSAWASLTNTLPQVQSSRKSFRRPLFASAAQASPARPIPVRPLPRWLDSLLR